MKTTITELQNELMKIGAKTTSNLCREKTQNALANIKRALTLLEKAELTLWWAKREESNREESK